MNDKIKEILDRLDYNEWEVALYKVPITWCELYDIRDYITNLQTKNEYLETWNSEIKLQLDNLQQEKERLEENNQAMQEEMARVWEENERLKKIRNEAICYNKELCKIYDCGMELSNAQTNLCVLEDTEILNILQNGSEKDDR